MHHVGDGFSRSSSMVSKAPVTRRVPSGCAPSAEHHEVPLGARKAAENGPDSGNRTRLQIAVTGGEARKRWRGRIGRWPRVHGSAKRKRHIRIVVDVSLLGRCCSRLRVADAGCRGTEWGSECLNHRPGVEHPWAARTGWRGIDPAGRRESLGRGRGLTICFLHTLVTS